MPSYTQFNGVSNVGDSLLMDQVEANLTDFFQWGFLSVGGFFNVTIPTSGYYGGNQHQLRLCEDTYYSQGQVWEGFRKDWVWETGVANARQPIRVSGVYVNGAFHSIASTGNYAHSIDYPRGRVVFNQAIPANSTVTCEYSYRLFQVTTADTPWWQQLQSNSFRVDDSQFMQFGSGAWSVLSDNRIQLPAVIIEAVPDFSAYGKQLGDYSQWVTQDVNVHVLTEDRPNMKFLASAIEAQKDKVLLLFDKNQLINNQAFPIDDRGMPIDSGRMYPDLLNQYGWKQAFISGVRGRGVNTRPSRLNYALIKLSLQVDMP